MGHDEVRMARGRRPRTPMSACRGAAQAEWQFGGGRGAAPSPAAATGMPRHAACAPLTHPPPAPSSHPCSPSRDDAAHALALLSAEKAPHAGRTSGAAPAFESALAGAKRAAQDMAAVRARLCRVHARQAMRRRDCGARACGAARC